MIVADDIAVWLTTRLNAVTTSVTGGFWNGRPDEAAASPYGVFLISRQGGTEYTSGAELPKFDVKLGVMVDQTVVPKSQAVQIAVGAAVPLVPTGATAMIRSGAGTVISATPKDCAADTAFPMRGTADVVAARFGWEVWCQAATTGV